MLYVKVWKDVKSTDPVSVVADLDRQGVLRQLGSGVAYPGQTQDLQGTQAVLAAYPKVITYLINILEMILQYEDPILNAPLAVL